MNRGTRAGRLAMFALLLWGSTCQAIDIHVSGVGSDAAGNGTAVRPFRTITRGLQAATRVGDFVLVHAGRYDLASGERFPIDMKYGVTVWGDDPASCVVAGLGDRPVFRYRYATAFNSETKLGRLTIQGGEVGVWMAMIDSAYPSMEDSRPTVTQNIIRGNTLEGIFGISASGCRRFLRPKIIGNRVVDNGTTGIAMANNYRYGRDFVGGCIHPEIIRNQVEFNGGAGLYFYSFNGSARVERNVIRSNEGAGIEVFAGGTFEALTLTNNAITGNADGVLMNASFSGGFFYPTIVNNTIADNGRYGITAVGWAYTDITNTIVWGHELDVLSEPQARGDMVIGFSDFATAAGPMSLVRNRRSNPRFVRPDTGDYRLRPGSPCIDSATSDGAPLGDLDGRRRIDDPLTPNTGGGAQPWFDMGCYEFVRSTTP